MPKKLRLDQLLVGRGLFPSREQARRAILAGERQRRDPGRGQTIGAARRANSDRGKADAKVRRPRRAEAGIRPRAF